MCNLDLILLVVIFTIMDIIYRILPVSWCSQVMIIHKLFKDLCPPSYFMPSIEDYSKRCPSRLCHIKLLEKYFSLSAIFQEIVIFNKSINKLVNDGEIIVRNILSHLLNNVSIENSRNNFFRAIIYKG